MSNLKFKTRPFATFIFRSIFFSNFSVFFLSRWIITRFPLTTDDSSPSFQSAGRLAIGQLTEWMFYCRRSFFFSRKNHKNTRNKKIGKKFQKNLKKKIREKCPAGRQNYPFGTQVHFNNFKIFQIFVEKTQKLAENLSKIWKHKILGRVLLPNFVFLPRKSKSTLYRPFQAQKSLFFF